MRARAPPQSSMLAAVAAAAVVLAFAEGKAAGAGGRKPLYVVRNGGHSLVTSADSDGVLLAYTDSLDWAASPEDAGESDPWLVLEENGSGSGATKICKAATSKRGEQMCFGAKEGGRVTLVPKEKALDFEIQVLEGDDFFRRAKLVGPGGRFLCSKLTVTPDLRWPELVAYLEKGYDEERCTFELDRMGFARD